MVGQQGTAGTSGIKSGLGWTLMRTFKSHEDSQAVEHVAQGDSSASIFASFRDQTG